MLSEPCRGAVDGTLTQKRRWLRGPVQTEAPYRSQKG